ncbi:MAG: iron chelate uptake ABC transporter family permease subunit, partial [Solibacillus isronensis]
MKKWKSILLWVLPLVLAIASLGIGRFEVDFVTVVKILGSHIFPIEETWTQMEYNVVMTVRLPRIILALLIGAGLSISGAAFQGMFANPLVSADILGVAAG